jgi:hypothetical protein
MITHFEKTYIATDYREYRENILFEKEIGLLPMTQPYVEKELALESINEEYKLLQKQQTELTCKIFKNRREFNQLSMSNEIERRRYVRKCPNNDCQGFLSQNLKCEICNSWVCSECREIKGTVRDAEHTCNPEILESVKMLAADTKPCPNCSAMIYKIEGCSQMFCTECHVAFNWNTLRVETGVIHNPHYFEWMRMQNGDVAAAIERNPNDVLCGRELDNRFTIVLRNTFVTIFNKQNKCSIPEIKKQIFDLLSTHLKPTYPQIYTNIMRDIHGFTDINNAERRNDNFYHYSQTLINYIYRYLMSRAGRMHELIDCMNQIDVKLFNIHVIIPLENIIQNTIHIREMVIGRWTIRDQIESNLDLRILYMRNKITPEKFKTQIQKRDKETQRNIEITNILRMYVSCLTDLLYRMVDKANNFYNIQNSSDDDYKMFLKDLFGKDNYIDSIVKPLSQQPPPPIDIEESILKECHALREYTNQCMKTVLTTYGSSMKPSIKQDFQYEP